MQTCAVVVVVVVVYEKDTLIIIKLSCKKIVSKWMWEEDFLFGLIIMSPKNPLPLICLLVMCCGVQLSRTEKPEPPMLQKKTWRRVNGEVGKGVPAGETLHGNLETCYNSNVPFLKSYGDNPQKTRQRMFRRTGPWDETRLCVELLKNGILNDLEKIKNPSTDCSCYEKQSSGGLSGDCGNAPSVTVDSPGCTIRCGDNVYTKVPPCPQESKPFYAPETFSKECETVLGIICRHQCNTLSQLYDIWDYRVYPPRMSQRKTDVTLDECVACLQDQDCAQRPIIHDQKGIHVIDYSAWGSVSKSALMPDRIPEQ